MSYKKSIEIKREREGDFNSIGIQFIRLEGKGIMASRVHSTSTSTDSISIDDFRRISVSKTQIKPFAMLLTFNHLNFEQFFFSFQNRS